MFQIIYFHKGVLVHSKECDAASSLNQRLALTQDNSLPSIANLVSQDASKLNNKFKLTSSGIGEECFIFRIVEELKK